MAEATAKEHRIVTTDVQPCLSGPSMTLTCACGWHGHSTMWNSRAHAAPIPGAPIPALPPAPEPPRISREERLVALYGETRGRRRFYAEQRARSAAAR
jgi:hypothetical protein